MSDHLGQVENVSVLAILIGVGRSTVKMTGTIPGFEALDCVRVERKVAEH